MQVIRYQWSEDGWSATFEGVEGMPFGPIPLPWTAQAPAAKVAADLRSRFEGALVERA